MMKLAVLIINYETPDYIDRLRKQFAVMDQSRFDLSIIDNSINNKTPYATKTNVTNNGFDQTVLQWLQDNKDKPYCGYWLLNSDCEINVDEQIIEKYQLLLNYDSTIGLLGSRVIIKNDPGTYLSIQQKKV